LAAKGTLAIADQGLFAGSNFILNVLLARWLTPAEYGTFALAYSAFLLFASFHSAALVEPMLVFGPGKYRNNLDEYLGILIRGHFLLMVPISLTIALTGGMISHWLSSAVGYSFLALALAVPFILLMWLLRRAFYVELRPGWAMCGGALYLLALVLLLFGLRMSHRLSTALAFLIMCVASLITSFLLVLLLHPRWSASSHMNSAEVARSHWLYGRWSIAAAMVSWFPLNIYYLVLPAWSGLAGSGALRALMNLINAGMHILIALATLLLPILVRSRREGGKKKMGHTMGISLLVFLSGTALFSFGVWMFRTHIFQVLYSGRYQQAGFKPLSFLLASLVATSCVAVLAAGLMAMERPDLNFWAYVGAAVAAVVVGLPLTAFRGVEGSAEGLLLSAVVTAGIMGYLFRRAAFRDRSVFVEGSEAFLVKGSASAPASHGL
jgi:O-antigen/teichoic acid export membrane protein